MIHTMKNAKKSSNAEPTITNVMGVVQGLAVSVQDLTEAVQEGFAKNETQHNEIKEDLNDIGYRESRAPHRASRESMRLI